MYILFDHLPHFNSIGIVLRIYKINYNYKKRTIARENMKFLKYVLPFYVLSL